MLCSHQGQSQARYMDRDKVISRLREHESELKLDGIVHLQLFGSVARGDEDSSRTVRTHLIDIAESIKLIQEFVAGLDLTGYRKDPKTRSAVELQLQIVAEAASRLGEKEGHKLMGADWRVLCD